MSSNINQKKKKKLSLIFDYVSFLLELEPLMDGLYWTQIQFSDRSSSSSL